MTTLTTTTTVTDRKNPIFVYGTLKRGFPYHHLLEPYTSTNEVVYVGRHKTLNPYPLVLGPLGVPILINRPGSGYRVTGELYLVASKVMPPLDVLEGIGKGHYDRLPVLVTPVNEDGGDGEVTEVEVYFAHEGYAQEMWEKCGKGSLEEYLISHVDEFCWDEEVRNVNLTLADHAHIFLDKIKYEVDLEPISASLTDKVVDDKMGFKPMPSVNKFIGDNINKVDLEVTSTKVDLELMSTVTNKVIDEEVDLEVASVNATEKVNGQKLELEPTSTVTNKVIGEKLDLKLAPVKVNGEKLDLEPMPVNAILKVIDEEKVMFAALTNTVIKV